MLKNIFADVYHLQRGLIVCLWCLQYRREYISCKWLINILFAVCKLFVWISASCWDVAKKFNHLVYNAFHIAENIFLVNVSNVLKSVWRFYFEWAILQIAGNHICDFLKRVHFEWANENIFVIDFVMLKKKKYLMKNIFQSEINL